MNRDEICHPVFFSILLLALANGSCGKRGAAGGLRDSTGKPISAVTALGRVTPGRAVISIAAQPGSRIMNLEVTEGEKVKAGDILAYLDSYMLRMAERDAAKVGVDHERKELRRVEALVSAKTFGEQNLEAQKFAAQSAEARLKAAEAQLELTIIRAPIDGEILKVFTYPGERIGNEPILKMGDTANMHVIAEVHESDVGAVRVGQRATITSEALPQPVQGVVEEIGHLIYKNDVLDLDPRADKDTRIVEVRVKLDDSKAVSGLTYLEVSVRIDLDTRTAAVKPVAR